MNTFQLSSAVDPYHAVSKVFLVIEKRVIDCLGYCSKSPSPLKPAGGAHDSHGLVHDPFADTKVVVDPTCDFFVLRDLFAFETGAMKVPHDPKGYAKDHIS
jgi:hypothetical protein